MRKKCQFHRPLLLIRRLSFETVLIPPHKGVNSYNWKLEFFCHLRVKKYTSWFRNGAIDSVIVYHPNVNSNWYELTFFLQLLTKIKSIRKIKHSAILRSETKLSEVTRTLPGTTVFLRENKKTMPAGLKLNTKISHACWKTHKTAFR